MMARAHEQIEAVEYSQFLFTLRLEGFSVRVSINDLRILDNEALFGAWGASHFVLPVYCVNPRLFGATYYFGFPKTGGILLPNFYNCKLLVFLKIKYTNFRNFGENCDILE